MLRRGRLYRPSPGRGAEPAAVRGGGGTADRTLPVPALSRAGAPAFSRKYHRPHLRISPHHFQRHYPGHGVQPAVGYSALLGRQPHTAVCHDRGSAVQHCAGHPLCCGFPVGCIRRRHRHGDLSGCFLPDLPDCPAKDYLFAPIPRRPAPRYTIHGYTPASGAAGGLSKWHYRHGRAGASGRCEWLWLHLHGRLQCLVAAYGVG